jgi:hypothetical protein
MARRRRLLESLGMLPRPGQAGQATNSNTSKSNTSKSRYSDLSPAPDAEEDPLASLAARGITSLQQPESIVAAFPPQEERPGESESIRASGGTGPLTHSAGREKPTGSIVMRLSDSDDPEPST